MIRVIEATPGAGKTCLVVEWLVKEIDRGFYKEFYTNISDLRIQGVKSIPLNFDWRTVNPLKNEFTKDRIKDYPILIIYDEAQYEDAFMKENRNKENAVGKDISTHRHYGVDMWLITQSSSLLNNYVLSNTNEHVFMYRPRKKKTVKIYWWSSIQKSLNTTTFKSADDEETWRLNPAMFPLYRSTAGVTDGTTRKSKKLGSILFTGFIILSMIGFMLYRGYLGFQDHNIKNESRAAPKVLTVDTNLIADKVNSNIDPVAGAAPVADEFNDSAPLNNDIPEDLVSLENSRVAFVLSSKSFCTAKNSSGHIIDMPLKECIRYSKNPALLGSSYLPPAVPVYETSPSSSLSSSSSSYVPKPIL